MNVKIQKEDEVEEEVYNSSVSSLRYLAAAITTEVVMKLISIQSILTVSLRGFVRGGVDCEMTWVCIELNSQGNL